MKLLINVSHIKSVLLGVVMLFFCVPFIQQNLKLVSESKLNGAITAVEKIYINKENWLNETYQQNFESYNNQNFGLRNLLVRLNNQIAYKLFSNAKASGVIVGKESYIYEEPYIKAHLGIDFVGTAKIDSQIVKLSKIQDTLIKLNKHIFILFAPGKGTFFPEFIPEKYFVQKNNQTNYKTYIASCNKYKVAYLDFNKWFVTMKPTAQFPLYSKAGVHWSKYGELLAADSLVKYISKIRNVNMPRIVVDSIKLETKNRAGDYDAGDGMNLLNELPTYAMGYPYFHLDKTNTTNTTKVMVMSDSYYWGMFNYGFSTDLFSNGKFWYYNEQIFPDSYEKPTTPNDVNIKDEVEKHDVVLLIATDASLNKFPFDFVNQLYDSYFNTSYSTKKRIQQITATIKSTPEWLDKIKQQAINENITLDKAIENNVQYVLNEENKKVSK
jgi:hypothetical protein